MTQAFTHKECFDPSHVDLLDSLTADVLNVVHGGGASVSATFTDPDGFTSTLSGTVTGEIVNFTISGFAANPGLGTSVTTYSGVWSGDTIVGLFSGTATDGFGLFGESDTCFWTGTFRVFIITQQPDPGTVQGALDRGVLRMRAEAALNEGRMLERLALAKRTFEEVRWLSAFQTARDAAQGDLKDMADESELALLMIRAESIDDARTAALDLPAVYPKDFRQPHQEFLGTHTRAVRTVNITFREARKLLFCPKPTPPPVPGENCAYILIITNTDIGAEGADVMTKTTDALVTSITKRRGSKDHCNKVVRVNVTVADIPMSAEGPRDLAALEAAHAKLQTTIDAQVNAAVIAGTIPAGAKACEIHTLGHGTGADILFGGLHYSLAPDLPGVLQPNGLRIERFTALLDRYLCCKDGKVFLWHCFLATPSVDVRTEALETLAKTRDQRTEKVQEAQSLQGKIEDTNAAIAALEGMADKDSNRKRQALEREKVMLESNLARVLGEIEVLATRIAVLEAATAGDSLDDIVRTRIAELDDLIAKLQSESGDEDLLDSIPKTEAAIGQIQESLASLARQLATGQVNRAQYEASKANLDEERKRLNKLLDDQVAWLEELRRERSAWGALADKKTGTFAAFLAHTLMLDCPARTVTAIQGIVEFPSNSAPRPLPGGGTIHTFP